MKGLRNYIWVLLLSLAAVACSPISEDERYIEMDAIEAKRVVLLEEFTGQTCPNCPTAHRTIEALQEQFGEAFIPVSIHAGTFAYEEGEHGDYFFKTPEGDQYAAMWNVQSYPSGVVNRTSGISLHTDWARYVRSELERPAELDIELSASIVDDEIQIETQLQPSANLNGQLQLWVLEDSIVSVQLDGATLLSDYVHNNVYRASVNGVGGEKVSLVANVYQKHSASLPLRSYWKKENLSIVAFVYNDKGVAQAARAYVK